MGRLSTGVTLQNLVQFTTAQAS